MSEQRPEGRGTTLKYRKKNNYKPSIHLGEVPFTTEAETKAFLEKHVLKEFVAGRLIPLQ